MGLTVSQMHIGIDLALQNLNSNLYGVLLPEEKDYYLNSTTRELLKLVLANENNSLTPYISLTDIKKYYSILQNHIVDAYLEVISKDNVGYIAKLPLYDVQTSTFSGTTTPLVPLFNGVKYKIVSGTIDLSYFGGKTSNTTGDTVLVDIANIKSDAYNIVEGGIYRILFAGNTNFASYGAKNNNYGTIFVCTVDADISDTVVNELEVIAGIPNYNTAVLKQLSTINYYYLIESSSLLEYGSIITSGQLVKGATYKVENNGTDFNLVGGYADYISFIFICNKGVTTSEKYKYLLSNADITWIDDTIVQELRYVPNRLIKPEDNINYNTNSFGSPKSNPITILKEDKIEIHTNNEYEVFAIKLKYIKAPIDVNSVLGIDSDLPSFIHDTLVELTALKIANHKVGAMGSKQEQQ